ncbi:hypothetical protein A7K92_23530 [Klebsiella pneumoniae]|nr:hypothetical protein A7K92_23530 [Klebsiella pneumoniae]
MIKTFRFALLACGLVGGALTGLSLWSSAYAMFLVVEIEKRLNAPVPQNGLNNLARLAAGARYCRKDPL